MTRPRDQAEKTSRLGTGNREQKLSWLACSGTTVIVSTLSCPPVSSSNCVRVVVLHTDTQAWPAALAFSSSKFRSAPDSTHPPCPSALSSSSLVLSPVRQLYERLVAVSGHIIHVRFSVQVIFHFSAKVDRFRGPRCRSYSIIHLCVSVWLAT
jgi:hypothetical protein